MNKRCDGDEWTWTTGMTPVDSTCARYMGCIELSVLEGGELYNGTLTEGLWLMWANEGASTVEQLMLEGTAQLAAAMSCGDATELGVTKKAMTELMTSLTRLHAAGKGRSNVQSRSRIMVQRPITLVHYSLDSRRRHCGIDAMYTVKPSVCERRL